MIYDPNKGPQKEHSECVDDRVLPSHIDDRWLPSHIDNRILPSQIIDGRKEKKLD